MLRHLRIPPPLHLVHSSKDPSRSNRPANLERHMAFIAHDVWQRADAKDVTYLEEHDDGPPNHESIRMQRAMLRWLYGDAHPDPKPGRRHKR